jgi:hypothetical protein
LGSTLAASDGDSLEDVDALTVSAAAEELGLDELLLQPARSKAPAAAAAATTEIFRIGHLSVMRGSAVDKEELAAR